MSAVSLGLKRRLIFTCYDYPGLISRFSLPVRVPLVAQMQSWLLSYVVIQFYQVNSSHIKYIYFLYQFNKLHR